MKKRKHVYYPPPPPPKNVEGNERSLGNIHKRFLARGLKCV